MAETHHRSMTVGRRRLAVIALLLAAVVPGAAALAQAGPELELVPHPDLSSLPAERAEALRPAVEFFQSQRSRLEGRQLGLAFGRLGLNYLAQDQGEAAEAALRNAEALDPSNPRWPYFLAMRYEESGRLEGARDAYRRSLRNQPTYLPGYVRLGAVLAGLDRYEEAEAAFQVVLNVDRDNPVALAGMGRLALERGDARKAAGLLRRALRFQPEADALYGDLATAQEALGEEAEAEKSRAQAGEVEPIMDDPLYAFLFAHERGAEHYLAAAAKAEDYEDPAAAMRFYEIASSLRPGDVAVLLRLGELQAAAGQSDEALFTFSRLLALQPDHVKANYYSGILLEQRGQQSGAEERYRAALEVQPQLVEPRMLLANSLMRRGEHGAAADEYARIAHQLPGSVEVMYLLGLAWLAADQCQWAHPVLLRGLGMAPGDPAVTTALARAYATCPGTTDEQRAQALESARIMYEARPGLENAVTLAMASAASGHYEDAVDFQAQAIFEALKAGDESRLAWLRENLDRYEAGQPAVSPWPADAEVYKPRRLTGPGPGRTAEEPGAGKS